MLKNYKKKDAKALYFLYRAVDESVFPRIEILNTSKEAWKTLKIAYQGMEKVKTAKPQFIEEKYSDKSLEKIVNVKNCLSHDEDDEEMVETHPQIAAPTQGQQETPLRRNECASPSTPNEATNEEPMNGRKELKFLEDLFKEYGV